ncbi:MAG: hypothetical protein MUO64_12000 [Anaerolineales bacterium]|nr:hypothetical protein [Anaerolineales bacterium]
MQRKIAHPGWNLDYLMFLFTRLSGLSILVSALVGMLVAYFMGARTLLDAGAVMRWIFFPNPSHVQASVPDVAAGWSNTFWQVIEIWVIFFAGTHGLNGLRMVIEDYVSQPRWLVLLRGVLLVVWVAGLIAAVYVILTT